MIRHAMFTLVVAACTRASSGNGSGSNGSATSSVPPAAPASPAPAPADVEKRARTFLQHQLDVATSNKDDLVATFTKDAVVMVDGNSSTADEVSMFPIGGAGADGAGIDKATISKLVAHGTVDAVWFYAEVTTHSSGPGKGPSHDEFPVRVVELITSTSQWKAVAASFGLAKDLHGAGDNNEIPNATGPAGPLGQLFGSPTKIAAKLRADAIVIGPTATQFATGTDAPTALASWKLEPLTMYKNPREVTNKSWGFVQASFDHPDADRPKSIDRLVGQTFAIPASDGSWSVVLVQYRAR